MTSAVPADAKSLPELQLQVRYGSQVYTYTDVGGGGTKSSMNLDMVDLNSARAKYWCRISTMTSMCRIINRTDVMWISDIPNRNDIGMNYIQTLPKFLSCKIGA